MSRRFKLENSFMLSAKAQSETQIKRTTVDLLRASPFVVEVYRQNAGKIATFGKSPKGAYDAFRYWLKNQPPKNSGHADIGGQLIDGRRFLFELKKPGGVISQDQEVYVANALLYHAVGGIVESPEEALQIIQEAFRCP